MKVQAIIPAAGSGTRFESQRPKQLNLLLGKPVFIYCLEAFERSRLIDSVLLVVPKDLISEFEKSVKQYKIKKVDRIVPGGPMRSDSVYNGLTVIDEDTDTIVVHDGARPLITTEIIDQAVALSESHEAVVVAVPVKPTIKKVDKETLFVEETLERDKLWEVQTPQVFRKEVLLRAYREAKQVNPTDDAVLVEQLGACVKVLEGNDKNMKITTKHDLILAEALLKNIDDLLTDIN